MITLWVRFGIMANSVKAFDSQFSTASSLVNHSLSPARQVEYQETIDVAIKIFFLRLPHEKSPVFGTNDYTVSSFWDNDQQF